MKKILLVSFLLLFVLMGCNSSGLRFTESKVDFDLASDISQTDHVIFISNESSFQTYLESSYFSQSFSQDFTDENSKYDNNFFEKHDLIAVIYWGKVLQVKDINISSIDFRDSKITVNIKEVLSGSQVNPLVGDVFTLYLTIDKLPTDVVSICLNNS